MLCAIDLFSKYALIVPLKDKKSITIANAFQKILDISKRKLNKIWVDQDSEFYKIFLKNCLEDNDIKMHSTYRKWKSVVAKRFIRIFKKKKICKHMTAVSKNFILML